MSFDPSTAREFDPSTAKPAESWVDKFNTAMKYTGPGMLATGAMEGMKLVGDVIDKAAYGAGGFVTDKLANMGASPEVAGGAGYVANVATQAVPTLLGGEAAKLASPLFRGAAERVMQSAVKPSSKSLANGDAAKAIDTMLSEGVSATAGGAAKLRLKINELKAEVAALIKANPGSLVDKSYVYKELISTLDEVSKLGRPDQARAAVQKAWNEFKNHPLASGANTPMPLALADDVKRTTQRSVKDAYGRQSSTPVDDKIDMAIAAGQRKGIEAQVPAIGTANAKLSEYLNALHQIEPRAAIAANRDLGGLATLGPTPEQTMLMLADRNPWIKSYVARVLNAGQKQIPATAGRAVGGAAVSVNNAEDY